GSSSSSRPVRWRASRSWSAPRPMTTPRSPRSSPPGSSATRSAAWCAPATSRERRNHEYPSPEQPHQRSRCRGLARHWLPAGVASPVGLVLLLRGGVFLRLDPHHGLPALRVGLLVRRPSVLLDLAAGVRRPAVRGAGLRRTGRELATGRVHLSVVAPAVR